MPNLFSEIIINNKRIKNRIVMPPMVCFGWTDDSGMVKEENIDHYERRAKGGTGLIILEATCVNKNGRLANTQLGIWSDEHVDGLSKIAAACHKYDSVVLVQIHHAGLNTPITVCQPAVAPSDYSDGKKRAVALTIDEIHKIQQDFVKAAVRAKKAGFDGVELHGAHGYLINQFASPIINKREDEYGGCLENRIKFASEIVQDIRKEVGDDFIIDFRMGGNEPTLDDGIQIAKILEAAGINLLHVSAGISSGEVPLAPENFSFNWIVYMGTEIKKAVNIPVIAVNSIRTPNQASYLVENELADFTAIGKGLLVDAEWANKARLNKAIKPCLKCRGCQWFKDGKLCPQNN